MSYDSGPGTGRHGRPRDRVEFTESTPPSARKHDPVAAVSRWWSLAMVVVSLSAAGWYAAQVLNGYADRAQVDAVQRDLRAVDARARDLEHATKALLQAQRDLTRRHEQLLDRLDWLVRQEIEAASRERRRLTSMPPAARHEEDAQ